MAFLVAEFSGNSILIFCASCATANRLRIVLRLLGYSTAALTGQMTQPKRLEALTRFKAGDRTVLLATDVASRGLDVPAVDLVVNYDMPVNPKDYVHRVGRTARAGRAGRAVTIVTQYDVEQFQRVEHLLGTKLDAYPAEERQVLSLLSRVEEAVRLANDEVREKEGRKEDARKRQRAKKSASGQVRGRPVETGDGEEDCKLPRTLLMFGSQSLVSLKMHFSAVAMALVKKAHVKKKSWK